MLHCVKSQLKAWLDQIIYEVHDFKPNKTAIFCKERECLVAVVLSLTTMVRAIGPTTVLLLQFLLLNIDPLIVVAVAVLVVAGVSRLILDSDPLAVTTPATSLRLVSLLSPPLAVPGATAGPLAPLPVPAAAPSPPVPRPGPVSSATVSAPAPLPPLPVPAPAPISPPVAVPVSLSAPVTTSVVSARVTDVYISPAFPCAAQTSS